MILLWLRLLMPKCQRLKLVLWDMIFVQKRPMERLKCCFDNFDKAIICACELMRVVWQPLE